MGKLSTARLNLFKAWTIKINGVITRTLILPIQNDIFSFFLGLVELKALIKVIESKPVKNENSEKCEQQQTETNCL